MELADYNISFVYIKGKDIVMTDAISRFKMLHIYKEPTENLKIPAVSNTQEHVTEEPVANMHTLTTSMLWTEQIQDITCKKLMSQLHHSD